MSQRFYQGLFCACAAFFTTFSPATAGNAAGGDTIYIVPSKTVSDTCMAFPLTLTAMTLGTGTLLWSDGSNDNTLKINDFGTYTVKLTTTTGVFTATYAIEQRENQCCRPLFPNAFTPDGDGTNEVFSPILQYCEAEYAELYVYSRWGELMYQGYSENERWDGTTLNGTTAQTDVYGYVYRYKLKGETEEKIASGEVTLLR